jgi:hypothetical protein
LPIPPREWSRVQGPCSLIVVNEIDNQEYIIYYNTIQNKLEINEGGNQNSVNSSFKEMYVTCPECKEVIKSTASRCKHCGCKLIASRSAD